MSNILKLKEPNFGVLNNAEFTFFASELTNQVTATGVETLHIPTAAYNAYKTDYNKLVEVVAQSRIAEETAAMEKLNEECDALIVYLMSAFRTGKSSPIASKKEAATTLFNQTKPYVGLQKLPTRQQVQTVDGFLHDLNKDENAAHIATLGLTDEVAALSATNAQLRILIETRSMNELQNPVESAKPIRQEMMELYDEIVTTAWAFSIAQPSEALTSFILFVNKLIDDTKAAYNLRIGIARANEEKKKEENSKDESEAPETPENSETPETPENAETPEAPEN